MLDHVVEKQSKGPSPPRDERPAEIPDHQLVKPIGRGSYGEVWLARSATGAYRAVKLVYRDRFDDEQPYLREFRGIQEFEPISRSHPNHVNVLHVGRNDDAGYYYYVMELADDANEETPDIASKTSSCGSPPANAFDWDRYAPKTLWSEIKARGRLPIDECLRIGASLAGALEHLHAHGLVHRDIKPSNVIFVKGEPKLADIGLVAQSTSAFSMVGTTGYMPPEGPGKGQADIFSLGKVVYEIATGKDRTEFPDPPEDIAGSKDHRAFLELNEILLTACESSTERRYKSPALLAADFRALLEGKSVKRKRLCKRAFNLSLKAVVGLAILAALIILPPQLRKPEEPRRAIFPSPVQVPLSINEGYLRPNLHGRFHDISPDGKRILYVRDAKLFVYENDSARQLFPEQSKEWRFIWTPTWSPDGRKIAVAANRHGVPQEAYWNLTLLVGDVSTSKLRVVSGDIPTWRTLLWRPDGLGLTAHARVEDATGVKRYQWMDIDLNGSIRVWNGLEETPMMKALATYSPDGKWLCAHDANDLWLVKPGGGASHRLHAHVLPETEAAWADNKTLYFIRSGSPRSETKISSLMRLHIDPETGLPLAPPEPVYSGWSQLMSPRVVDGGRRLVFFENTSHQWIINAADPDSTVGRGDSPRLSPDGAEVYYINRMPGREGIYARTFRAGGRPRLVVSAKNLTDGCFDLSPDGKWLVYGSLEPHGMAVIKLIDHQGGSPTTLYRSPLRSRTPAGLEPRWSPDGKLIALSGPDKKLLLINPDSKSIEHEVMLSGFQLLPPEWSPTGEHLACVLYDANGDGTDVNHRVELYTPADRSTRTVLEPGWAVDKTLWHPDPARQELTCLIWHRSGSSDSHKRFLSVSIEDGRTDYFLPLSHSEAKGGSDYYGVWEPAGRLFYFLSIRYEDPQAELEAFDVYAFDTETGVVLRETLPRELPFWSRDGKVMGWSHTRDDLKLMEIDLTRAR